MSFQASGSDRLLHKALHLPKASFVCTGLCVFLCVCLVGIAANYKPGHTLAHRAALQCSQGFCAEINLLLYNLKRSLSTGCCVKCGATERVQPLQLWMAAESPRTAAVAKKRLFQGCWSFDRWGKHFRIMTALRLNKPIGDISKNNKLIGSPRLQISLLLVSAPYLLKPIYCRWPLLSDAFLIGILLYVLFTYYLFRDNPFFGHISSLILYNLLSVCVFILFWAVLYQVCCLLPLRYELMLF